MVDLQHCSEHESGDVYNILDHGEAAFISTIVEEPAVKTVHAARSPNLPIPPGVVIFRDREGSRDPVDRAELWAGIHDRVLVDEPLTYRADIADECRRACVPAVIAGDGSATVAAYLAAHGFDNGEIAGALDVGNRTVSQYLTDFKAGER